MNTKAAILVRQKTSLEIGMLELPALKGGQVLVDVRYASICGQQIDEINGTKGPDPYLPHLLGHEGSGVVAAVGPGVSTVKVGDHVVLHWRKGSGLEGAPAQYRWKDKTVNAGRVTCFQAKSVVSENRVTAIPKSVDLKVATLYGCCVTTAFGAIYNDAKVISGQSVVIFGSGGMGLAEIMAARTVNAHPIIAVDRYDHKLNLAKELGATHLVNANNDNVRKKVLAITGAKGADVTIENTGKGPVIELCYELTAPQGKTILVGVPSSRDKATIDTLPLHFGKLLTGSHGGDAKPNEDIPRYLEWARQGKFDPSKLITNQYTLSGINQAMEAMRKGEAIRCLIETSK